MLTKFKSYRLGEILVRKGIISREQLKIAIQEQQHRRRILHTSNNAANQSTCLGVILTELGYIDQKQLKRGLNWQLVFRKVAIALAFLSPFLGTSSANAATTTLSVPATIQTESFSTASGVQNEATADVGGGLDTGYITPGDWMNYLNKPVNIPTTGYYFINFRVASPNGGGSFTFNDVGSTVTRLDGVSVPKTGGWQKWSTVQRKIYIKSGVHYFNIQVVNGGFNLNWFQIVSAASASSSKSSSSVKSSATSSKSSSVSSKSSSSTSVKSSSSSSKSSLPSGYTHVAGPVGLSWAAPKYREDKSLLDITELGGYQVRYKKAADSAYTYVNIKDAWTNTYNISWLEGDYVFQIAAFDKLGVYSSFSNFIN